MANENDRLVFDYLSRVGDLAQRRQVPAAERRELVSGLRDEIERRREVRGEAVPGILDALGTPDEVVGRVSPAPGTHAAASSPSSAPREPRKSRTTPRTTPPASPAASAVPEPRTADWWQDGTADTGAPVGPYADTGPAAHTGAVPGFIGGVEIPELLKPPPAEDEEEAKGQGASGPAADDGPGPEGAGGAGRFARLRGPRLGSPLLLIAAALLLVGAAVGSLVPLAAGWLLAYASRERRGAVLVVPGAAAAAGAVWLWGRVEGRWGDAVAPGGEAMGAAVAATWPWTLRAAAIGSALFLLWRSRRR
ncbi:hypothetical protein RGF97_14000 [Streptomyces roseicoloratus]|uniref:Integral membrane protein n=1 Tax=Streptomyces roseicoloratus TaxID=2508722 RepID=A0ABY9RU89_9ACTN|nr:hypothetical protein [Streptomyces roseicoloratus]WMX45746.1 hypothetical protein RGF97_14000 [Streptomyces roseicoloratus]